MPKGQIKIDEKIMIKLKRYILVKALKSDSPQYGEIKGIVEQAIIEYIQNHPIEE